MKLDSNALDEHNYGERMKRLVGNETKIEIRETTLCKKSAKVHQKYINAIEAFVKQQEELQKLVQVVADRSKEVEERASFCCNVQEALDATKERNSNKKDLLKQSKSTVRQQNNVIMECMHTLKEVTGTYINHGALPGREKGVIVMRDKWIPFNYPARDRNGLPVLWQKLYGPNNGNADKWRKLFPGALKVAAGTEDKMGVSGNPNRPPVTSIIEIDLTSPTNTEHT